MNELLRAIPMFNAALACFNRIQQFLNSDARRDHRIPLNGSTELEERPVVSAFPQGYELQDMLPVSRDSSPLLITKNASFGWSPDGPPDVSDITFTLNRHQFCFIIGPVGKSLLLFTE